MPALQLTQKKTALQFKTVDQTLQTYNKDTFEKQALSYRCSDIDRLVPQAMGVSKVSGCGTCHQSSAGRATLGLCSGVGSTVGILLAHSELCCCVPSSCRVRHFKHLCEIMLHGSPSPCAAGCARCDCHKACRLVSQGPVARHDASRHVGKPLCCRLCWKTSSLCTRRTATGLWLMGRPSRRSSTTSSTPPSTPRQASSTPAGWLALPNEVPWRAAHRCGHALMVPAYSRPLHGCQLMLALSAPASPPGTLELQSGGDCAAGRCR